MAVDFSALVYLPNFNFWFRPITVTPVASQPGGAAYANRGIIDTRGTAVQTDVGQLILSDQETICDIREREFAVTPAQGDIIDVPEFEGITDMVGTYVVTDATWNGGGEVTLVIQRFEQPQAETTQVTVTSSLNPSVSGQLVNFIAEVESLAPQPGYPTGSALFTVDGVPQPAVPLVDRIAMWSTSTLSVSTHTIDVDYIPDDPGKYAVSNGSLIQTVN